MDEPHPAASQHSGRVLSLSAFSEELLATRFAATKLFVVVVVAVKPLIAFKVQSREEEAVNDFQSVFILSTRESPSFTTRNYFAWLTSGLRNGRRRWGTHQQSAANRREQQSRWRGCEEQPWTEGDSVRPRPAHTCAPSRA